MRGSPAQRHVLTHFRADRRQRIGERHDALEFGALAHFPKARVVAILLAPTRIAACGLDVPICERANPHVRPGGRDGKGANAEKHMSIRKPGALRSQVRKPFARPLSSQPWPLVGDIAQTRRLGGLPWGDNRLNSFCARDRVFWDFSFSDTDSRRKRRGSRSSLGKSIR